MDLNKIENSEMLYRAVRQSDPDAFIDGKPTPALFMDSKGVSVDRDGGRFETEIIENFRWRFRKRNDYKTAVKVSAGACRTIGTFPVPTGNHRNCYHAEIWESESIKPISLLKAIQLFSACQVV